MNPARPSGARSPSPRPPMRTPLPARTPPGTPVDVRVPWPADIADSMAGAHGQDVAVVPLRPHRPSTPLPLPAIGEVLPSQMQRTADGGLRRERPLDFRLDCLLHSIAPGVFKRIIAFHEPLDDVAAVSMRQAGAEAFTSAQLFSMTNSWQIACATGSAAIGGDDRHARACAVSVQHFVEAWLTERLQGPAPFAVVAAIHTPAPPSPLRHWADAPVPAALLAPHLRDDASVQATLSRRAGSMRALLNAGATVHALYSAASLEQMDLAERDIYKSTCATYPNLIDKPSDLPPEAFRALCGATYLFGTGPHLLTGCFAIRLPQAADAAEGPAQAQLFVASQFDAPFKILLDELSRDLGIDLDPAYGSAAAWAMIEERGHI